LPGRSSNAPAAIAAWIFDSASFVSPYIVARVPGKRLAAPA
jgi:hypothetical protein